ncbi:hypothetical protein BDF22DRAFT_170556 [Syncephalis plumigaleata]|nr:hypothetical protein BDF22DRAFT_170556 [Syncephalis plumigaleata]
MTTEFNTMMLLRWELSNCLTLMFGRYAFRNPRSYASSDRGDINKCSAPPSNQAEIYQASSAPTMTNPSTTHATTGSAHMLRCRRHRSHTCHHCAARSTDEQPLGLLKSVSAFVACSADYFVNMNGEERNNWFRILLDLQTQAIIEGYLCDNQSIFDLVQKAFLLQTQSEFKDLFQLDHEAFSNYQQAREERMDEILNINPDERYLSHLLRLNTKYKEQDTMDTLLLYIYNMYIKLETPILYQHATLSLTTLHPYQRAMLTSPILDALSLVDDLYLQCKYANPLDRLHGITTSDRHDDDDGNNNSN